MLVMPPLTMTGYFDDPVRTAETVDQEGWLHTGDLCSMDADGNLSIHGRLREVVIRGGENVYPAEVELALGQIAGVAEVCVLGVPDARWGEVGRFLIRRPYVHPVDVDIALGIDRYDFAVRVGFEDGRPVARIETTA